MRVAKVEIENFRGIKQADLTFQGHTLLLGPNNVGKSTLCEALELVLGPERLNKYPPIQEYDFYNATYLKKNGDSLEPIPLKIQVTLVELSEEVATKCAANLAYWRKDACVVLDSGEAANVDHEQVCECLRLRTVGQYDPEQDEFVAQTEFVDGPVGPDGASVVVPRWIKQLFGFLYLRALRTGSRALSLERNSLLDVILRRRKVVSGIWQSSIERLKELTPPIDEGAAGLAPILENIEKRVNQYIPLVSEDRATKLFVSQLTREHLRKTISFFLSTASDQEPVPFQEVGTGTLNALVLALLTFIADIKKDNVIFAMEEPEIALSPHTQRRIANYLLQNATQCFVSSHSPYIIEKFDPEQVRILRRDNTGAITAVSLPGSDVLKGKTYRRYARRGLAEAMLGRGVIVAEGPSERDALLAAAEKLEETDPDSFYPLDLSGVTVISADGEGSMAEFGAFFRSMQMKTFAFYDAKPQADAQKQKFTSSFDLPCQTTYVGLERLLAAETPCQKQWDFLTELRASGENDSIPAAKPATDDAIRLLTTAILKSDKGSGYAGRLIGHCTLAEMPTTVGEFLKKVYAEFPAPQAVPNIDEATAKLETEASEGEDISIEAIEAVMDEPPTQA